MRIHLLGTAAGGGVPQWNCNCLVCREARAGTGRVQPRTQSSVAVSADDRHWFLLNASPDLRLQFQAFTPLHPPANKARSSTLQSVLLTNADLDHTLGLLLLREGERLRVHATAAVRHSLSQILSFEAILSSFCGIEWILPPLELSPLRKPDGTESGLLYQCIPLAGQAPRFARVRSRSSPSPPPEARVGERRSAVENSSVQTAAAPHSSPNHVIGYRLVDQKTGGRLLFLPDVARIDPVLNDLLFECDVLLFDGTFWSEDEMQRLGVGELSASAMGHLPISGPGGSLEVLSRLKTRRKTFVHINNTNPILLEDSPERAAVHAAGCQVGRDGMELVI